MAYGYGRRRTYRPTGMRRGMRRGYRSGYGRAYGPRRRTYGGYRPRTTRRYVYAGRTW